jgi:radical SAM-linked protein
VTRVRLKYAKQGKVRFLSHRDMAKVVERAIRRSGVPVAYSQGFSPRPKLHFGLALPTGYESDGEYLDIDLDPDRAGTTEPDLITKSLQECVPNGITLLGAAEVDQKGPSLQSMIVSTVWVALVGYRIEELQERCSEMLDASTIEIEIERKGKQRREDLRPLLHSLEAFPAPAAGSITDVSGLRFALGTKPRSIRPSELLDALGITEPIGVRRLHQWTETEGVVHGPMGEPTDASSHANERAS